MDAVDLANRFGFHRATDVTGPLHNRVRELTIDLVAHYNDLLPDSREKSLAMTALQEAQQWANAAIACNLAPLVDDEPAPPPAAPPMAIGKGFTPL